MKTPRRQGEPFLFLVTLLTLIAMPALAILHLSSIHRQMEKLALEIPALIAQTPIEEKILGALDELATNIARPSDAKGPTERLVPAHLLMNNDQRWVNTCEPFTRIANVIVSESCAVIIVDDEPDTDLSAELRSRLDDEALFLTMQTLYNEIKKSWQVDRSSTPVTFVHLTVFGSRGKPISLIYPGTPFRESAPIKKRPWNVSPHTLGHFTISGLYKDLLTQDLVTTLSMRRDLHDLGEIVLGIDYRVLDPGKNSFGYILNILILGSALAIYRYYYQKLKYSFIVLLGWATFFVLSTYILLAALEYLAPILGLSVTTAELLVSYVHFVPSDTLFIAAAMKVFRGPKVTVRLVVSIGLVQMTLAVCSMILGNPLPSVSFAFLSLSFVGFSFLKVASRFPRRRDFEGTLNPRSMAWITCVSYIVWGLCQFSLVMLSEGGSLSVRALGWIDSFIFALTDPGNLFFLLYLKGVAIAFTAIFLESCRRLENLPRPKEIMALTQDGRIQAQKNIPLSFDISNRRAWEIPRDPLERAEIRYAFERKVSMRNFLVREISEGGISYGSHLMSLVMQEGVDPYLYLEHLGAFERRSGISLLTVEDVRVLVSDGATPQGLGVDPVVGVAISRNLELTAAWRSGNVEGGVLPLDTLVSSCRRSFDKVNGTIVSRVESTDGRKFIRINGLAIESVLANLFVALRARRRGSLTGICAEVRYSRELSVVVVEVILGEKVPLSELILEAKLALRNRDRSFESPSLRHFCWAIIVLEFFDGDLDVGTESPEKSIRIRLRGIHADE